MQVSILLLTYNEAANLPRCLEALTWCDTLLERAAVGDHCAWAHALTVVALSLPGLEDAPRERFRALQRRLDLDDQ